MSCRWKRSPNARLTCNFLYQLTMNKSQLDVLIGTTSNNLTCVDVIVPKSGRKRLLCKCSCGGATSLFPYQFISGEIKSCGCIKHNAPHNATHKLSKTKLYHIWETMRLRCHNPSNKKYYMYGARGITVCDEWINDFLSFQSWSYSSGYADGLSIDRIDNSAGYSPSNCRWVDRKTQQRNTRRNIYIEYNGETRALIEWCEILNLP